MRPEVAVAEAIRAAFVSPAECDANLEAAGSQTVCVPSRGSSATAWPTPSVARGNPIGRTVPGLARTCPNVQKGALPMLETFIEDVVAT
jgi:hypothetical protein